MENDVVKISEEGKMKAKIVCALIVVVNLVYLPIAKADVVFNDGQTHNVDYIINDSVQAYSFTDFWGLHPTMLNVMPTGSIGGWINSYDNSQVSIMGGSVGGRVIANNNSTINLIDGVVGNHLYAYDNAVLNVTGGNITYYLRTHNTSEAFISGGTIGSNVYSYMQSHITMTDGLIYGSLFALGTSRIDLYGGTIQGYIEMGWDITHSGTIIIHGTNFAIDGVPIESGSFTTFPDGTVRSGHLTGVLANGDLLDNDVFICGGTLVLIPEPMTLSLITLGGLFLRRKRKV